MQDRPAPRSIGYTCPLCTRPVLDKQPVYFDHGELIHVICGRSTSGPADSVAALLRTSAGQRSCHDCLARLMEMAYEDVRKATMALRLTDGFMIELGAECEFCRKVRVTISFRERAR